MAVKKPPVLIEIANTIEPVHDGCIHIEKINAPFLYRDRGAPGRI
jgi:hypothetical protein